ncbi:MAG TPA: glycosyltransferase [Chitinispirillaceae bacterium]|nr:glycosyltransferase [Chitinispirillaceae bacterium]
MALKGLDIAFFGSSLLSAYWNGAATYYRGIIKVLHALGHRVTFYEPDIYDRQKNRDITVPSWARSVVYIADEQGLGEVLEMASESDVVVKTSGIGRFDGFLEEAVLRFQRRGAVVIFWDVDAPCTLDRVLHDSWDPFRKLIPRYDTIFTYGGGEPVVSAYRSLGARDCVPIYNALDPETHFPVPGEERFRGTLGFLGNRLPDREERVKEFFFRSAAMLPDRVFLLGGSGWERDVPDYPNIRRLGHVFTHEHNAFNCSNLAVLNINRQSMASYGYSPPTRIFEAAGAGACIITDAWEGIGQFLKPGSECLVARSGCEVAEYVRELNSSDAAIMGEAARRRVLAEHTYFSRAREVEQVLGTLVNREGVKL